MNTFAGNEFFELAERYLARHYTRFKDLMICRAEGSRLVDINGKNILDFLACFSASAAGHGHREITMAAVLQLITGLTACPGKVLHPSIVLCAERLTQLCGMDKVVFKNGGTEAFESAVLIARKWGYTNKGLSPDKAEAEIIVCKGNFHGRTFGARSASDVPQYTRMFGPLMPGFVWISYNDIVSLEQAISSKTVAVILEPVQGEGGINVPYDGYLRDVYRVCDNNNVLLIADEIQTGFGRTGKMFACQWEDVQPDLYVLGKALGGGFVPISAVVGPSRIMNVLESGEDGSTFGGNPYACAVALAAMKVIERENLPGRALASGTYFMEWLRHIADRSKYIKEVRGKGLLVGIEIKQEYHALEFVESLLKEGLLCCDARNNVVRFSPPLNISQGDLYEGIQIIGKVFTS